MKSFGTIAFDTPIATSDDIEELKARISELAQKADTIKMEQRKNAKNTATRAEVYEAIDTERAYQDRRWNEDTTLSEGRHSPEEWLTYIEDYLNEVKHLLSREASQTAYPKAMHIIRKITAMGVCAMEQLGAPKRTTL